MPDSDTSESRHGIAAQPDPCCPLIDDALDEVAQMQRGIRGYERAGEDELRAMLSDIEWRLGLLSGYSRTGVLEDIRKRTVEIRAWGEEWKQLALEHAPVENEA